MKQLKIHVLYSLLLVSSALQFASGYTSVLKSQQKRRKYSAASLPNLSAHFSDMCGGCGKKHLLSVSTNTFKKKGRNPRRVFENLTKFLSVLSGSRMNFVKRDTERNDHIVKCLQQNENTVTCFSRGKFYQFEGNLQKVAGEHRATYESYKEEAAVHKRRRFCSNCAFSRKTHLLDREPRNFNASDQIKKLSTIRQVMSANRRLVPYQEVMIEPSSRKWHPQSCYGFVAPQAAVIFSKKASSKGRNLTDSKPKHLNSTLSGASIHQPDESLVSSQSARSGMLLSKVLDSRGVIPSKYNTNGNTGPRSQRSTSLTHFKAKRSQILSVGCRPLYIPTAKPSVNEGRVPQCRIPCGAHNCGPFPTCPCRPPSRTPPPPPTTCPPIPGLAESEATLTLPTRCPAYEFTDEPCPMFECKDGCPYLTTPGCPPESARPHKGLPCKGQPIKEVSNVSSVYRNGTGIDSVPRGPSTKVLVDQGKIRTTVVNHHPTTNARIAPAAQTPKISTAEKPSKEVKEVTSVIQGARSNSNVAAKLRMEPLLKSSGSQYVDSQYGSKVPGVWSNFDFKKLLKSAKSHYKEKVELNNRNHRSEA